VVLKLKRLEIQSCLKDGRSTHEKIGLAIDELKSKSWKNLEKKLKIENQENRVAPHELKNKPKYVYVAVALNKRKRMA